MLDERAPYVAELTGLLSDTETPDGTRYRVVPSAARPRLLVPAGSARAAASAVRFSVEATGRKARLRRQTLSAAFRLGAGGLLCRDTVTVSGLDAYLSTVLGQPVRAAVHIGPPRANRKPVLTLLDPAGRLLGFAKVGVNALTRTLVDAEASALRNLASAALGPVTVPAVRHHGPWGEHVLLVQEALPVWLPRAAPAAASRLENEALGAVTRCLGTRLLRYPESPYAARLTKAVGDLDGGAAAERLASIVDTLTGRGDTLPFGCWHGDWNGANNAALRDGRVLVWDWERFDPDVPAGFDALHLALQAAITRQGVAPMDAAHDLFDRAAAGLDAFGVPESSADLVAALYLVELGTRYLRDRQAEAGARLGRISEWLLPAVEERLT